MSDNNDFWKGFCEYHGYPYFEEPEDPFLDDLINIFDFFRTKLKTYHMTYDDMRIYLGKSLSYLYKKIPEYVQDNKLIRYGTKNSAKFVLSEYEQQYLDSRKVEPLADIRSFIEPTIYIDRLQLRLVPSNTYGNNLYEEWNHYQASKPNQVQLIVKIKKHIYKFLFSKKGSISIYVDFEKEPKLANLDNFLTLFDNLRTILSKYNNHFITYAPHSFIISQFRGHREPFKKSSKIPVNINQSLDLPELLQLLHTSSY